MMPNFFTTIAMFTGIQFSNQPLRWMKRAPLFFTLLMALTVTAPTVYSASVTDQLLQQYREQGAGDFSEKAGEQLWQKEVSGRSCASCHSADATQSGRHYKTKKVILPLAPSTNPQRLTEVRTVKKWLKRNCRWVFKRECTVQERGDFLSWLQVQ